MGRLESFLAAARHRIETGYYEAKGEALRPNGSLRHALTVPAAVLAELKPRSPSTGRLLQGPPEAMLDAYVQGGAAGLSVLTDSDFFDGDPALVRAGHATGLPVLWKDFVIDPAQVAAAAHHGASAVLLIERCFPDAAARETLVQAAHDHGLEAFLELHDDRDWQRAQASEADLWGVNARDLDALTVDLDAARHLVATLAEADRHAVALSGIRDRHDRRRAEAAGARGVLVGTHLMQAPDPALALRALQRPIVKVCGLAREEDIVAAAHAGADMAGFVVESPGSPRSLTLAEAVPLAAVARSQGLRPVLVTTEKDAGRVAAWAAKCGVDWIQSHGADPAPLRATGRHVLWATAPDGTVPEGVDGLVVDTPSRHGVGGSGSTHDWHASRRLLERHRGTLLLIAGGLAADNAAEAVTASGASGADASSRLESAPGEKVGERVEAYVRAVRSVP